MTKQPKWNHEFTTPLQISTGGSAVTWGTFVKVVPWYNTGNGPYISIEEYLNSRAGDFESLRTVELAVKSSIHVDGTPGAKALVGLYLVVSSHAITQDYYTDNDGCDFESAIAAWLQTNSGKGVCLKGAHNIPDRYGQVLEGENHYSFARLNLKYRVPVETAGKIMADDEEQATPGARTYLVFCLHTQTAAFGTFQLHFRGVATFRCVLKNMVQRGYTLQDLLSEVD